MIAPSDILNARILIVDDRRGNVELIRGMLADAGYTSVASTTDPREVCDLHRLNRYDLILLDVMMPEMDGFQVMEGLRKIGAELSGPLPQSAFRIEQEVDLPVLVITAQPGHEARALEAGAKGFITKPFDRLEVLTHIRDVLEIRLLQQKMRWFASRLEAVPARHPEPLREAEDPLDQLVHYDALTHLPDRALFHGFLQKVIKQAQLNHRIVSVLFIDIDDFKSINETFGYGFGDELLREFSLRLLECLRMTDIVARLGGDEFGCILVAPDGSANAAIVVSKIREALRRPFDLHGHRITLTASIGISVYPTDSRDADTLVKNGDTAMYRSKKAGKDTYRYFTAEMNAQAMEKLDRENALRHALDRNEFILHYQPKVDLVSGRVTGVEALIRWKRSGYGIVAPLEFIPLLEQTGLISQVGAWVIESACRQIAEWRRQGAGEIPVSVNVSGRQFSQGTLNQDVIRATRINGVQPELLEFELQAERALRENSIESDLLELELTESSLMMHARKTAVILGRLKGLGIRISIDDFGMGYSSLSYVKRFPVDALKIDHSFIREITTNSADAAITTAIIDMAHSLGMRVVAEGVETAEQFDFLRKRACDEVQGYYFAQPLPAEEISELFLSGKEFIALA